LNALERCSRRIKENFDKVDIPEKKKVPYIKKSIRMIPYRQGEYKGDTLPKDNTLPSGCVRKIP
jgi:hypothetical protein